MEEQKDDDMENVISPPSSPQVSTQERASPTLSESPPRCTRSRSDIYEETEEVTQRIGYNPSLFKEFKNAMAQVFGMTDIGLMSYYLGIEVTEQDDGIFIFQEGYAKEILNEFKMDDANPVSTPVECGVKLSKKDIGEKVDPTFFKSLVGSLGYLTCTRPDILFGIGLISRYMEAPTVTHMKAAKRILRYLKAEYISVTSCVCQAIWLRFLLRELHLPQEESTKIFVDNKSAIALAKNPVFHDRSKHINARYHYITKCITEKAVELKYVKSQDQVAGGPSSDSISLFREEVVDADEVVEVERLSLSWSDGELVMVISIVTDGVVSVGSPMSMSSTPREGFLESRSIEAFTTKRLMRSYSWGSDFSEDRAARNSKGNMSKENENPNMVTNPYQAIVMARDSLKQKEESMKMQSEIERLDDEVKELKEKTEDEKSSRCHAPVRLVKWFNGKLNI
ncbi:hypothetical protein RJ640_023759 [Escallonia rubra]|uniref:Reverse transcriptase Ty1/copia-type domain-containing protein n=1 Tax=Escallonia rubra TaxID=112253 RepID=A0AA88QXU6_9ASTE|nr:hypothetical protein RJ640_023759 [Escallonia rubra]